MRPYIKGCDEGYAKGKRTIVATGHSLGAGAVEVMAAYGDSKMTWAFAPPRIFKETTCKMDDVFVFYAKYEAPPWQLDSWDVVPGMFGNVFGLKHMHCAETVYGLIKSSSCPHNLPTCFKSALTDTYKMIKGRNNHSPYINWGKRTLSAVNFNTMHHMFASYLPYLDGITEMA